MASWETIHDKRCSGDPDMLRKEADIARAEAQRFAEQGKPFLASVFQNLVQIKEARATALEST